jgi:6-pyruvoyltetrahydropterin/6-carboxytetrahydropterin synthase
MNQRVRITKVFHFEMAHALHGHGGKCAQLHGHSYELHVTVSGTPINDPDRPDHGMVMDFGELKSIVKREVMDRFDHALVLSERDRGVFDGTNALFSRVEYAPFQPTCENLLLEIARVLTDRLPAGAVLSTLRLWETPTSYAEWAGAE